MRLHIISLVIGICAHLVHATTSSADEEQVLTPGGLRPKSQFRFAPPGSRIQHTAEKITLFDKDGSTIYQAPHISAVPKVSAIAPRYQSGWVTYAYWYDKTNSSISSFTSSWTVPPLPTSDDGQTIFLFSSIEPASGDAILQPVLQYGPSAVGGGSYWAVAAWYVTGTQTFSSTLVPVKAGQTLTGSITLLGNSTSGYNYDCSFTNVPDTDLKVQNTELLVWATETLEIYGAIQSSDFPVGATTFTSNIQTLASSNPAVKWTVINDTSDLLVTSIANNAASNGQISINFPIPISGSPPTSPASSTISASSSTATTTSSTLSTTKTTTASLTTSATSTSKISSITTSSTGTLSCSSAKWGQCGGQNYNGCTICVSGSTCTFSNDNYSQCL